MKYGCIGEHLKHSFSKEIHNALADYDYEIKEVSKAEFDDFMIKRDFLAINVTIPYKESIIPYLSFIDDNAKEIGAVNTIVNKDGKLFGYNTDFYGLSQLIRHANVEIDGKKVAILGTGGTSKTARAVVKSLGANEIQIVSRTAKDGCITYEQLYNDYSDIDVIINTTPVGMYPNIYGVPVNISKLKHLIGVIDVVYNPLRTQLVLSADKLHVLAEGGLYMLVAQGVKASEIFLDTKYCNDVIDSVYGKIKKQKENIVLIGMPSSGKSTVGKLIAKKLNRKFIDTDKLIEEKVGTSISMFIEKKGINEFREIEHEIVKELSTLNGCVVATGGGVPLRDNNMESLKPNGKVYFIDRPLDALTPTDDRPLSRTKEAIAEQYTARYGIYMHWADKVVSADCDAKTVTGKILEDFNQ